MSWDEALPQWPGANFEGSNVDDLRLDQYDVRVLTAVVGPSEGEVARAVNEAAGLTLARRCADSAELLGAAQAGLGAVAVISSDLVGFDRTLIADLARESVRVVAVNDPLDQSSADRLAALGVQRSVSLGDIEEQLATAIEAVLGRHDDLFPAGVEPGREAAAGSSRISAAGAANAATPTKRGNVIAIWGTHGAPGRSTLAAGIAFALADARETDKRGRTRRGVGRKKTETAGPTTAMRERASVLLVDADTYAPSQTQALGLLEESSGLAMACRAASMGTLGAAALQRSTAQITDTVGLLTGLPRTTRWPELSATAMRDVLDASTALHDWVVVDCAASIEEDELAVFDTHVPSRNAATLTALDRADLVVVVGKGDPLGVRRLVGQLELRRERESLAETPYVVVVNAVPNGRSAQVRRAEITDALAKYSGELGPILIGYDPATAEAAMNTGVAVTEGKASDLSSDFRSLAQLISNGFGS